MFRETDRMELVIKCRKNTLYLVKQVKQNLQNDALYVVGSKSFRPDIQKPRQMENAVRDI